MPQEPSLKSSTVSPQLDEFKDMLNWTASNLDTTQNAKLRELVDQIRDIRESLTADVYGDRNGNAKK